MGYSIMFFLNREYSSEQLKNMQDILLHIAGISPDGKKPYFGESSEKNKINLILSDEPSKERFLDEYAKIKYAMNLQDYTGLEFITIKMVSNLEIADIIEVPYEPKDISKLI